MLKNITEITSDEVPEEEEVYYEPSNESPEETLFISCDANSNWQQPLWLFDILLV